LGERAGSIYRELAGKTENRRYPVRRGKQPVVAAPVREYLSAIVPGLADVPIRRLPELTPAKGPRRAAGCNGFLQRR